MTGLHILSAQDLADELRSVLGQGTALPDEFVWKRDAACALAALERLRAGLEEEHRPVGFHEVIRDGYGLRISRSRGRSLAALVADHLIIFLLELGRLPCAVTGEPVSEGHLAACPEHRLLMDGLIRSFVAAFEPEGEGDGFMRPYRDALAEMRAAAEDAEGDAPPSYQLRCRLADGGHAHVSVPVATGYQVRRIRADVERFGRDAGLIGAYAASLAAFAQSLGIERLDDPQFDLVRRQFFIARGLPQADDRDDKGG